MTAEEYLLQYQRAKLELMHTQAAIEAERQRIMGLRAIVYDDMPKSRDTERDLSAAFAVFEDRARGLREAAERNAAIMSEVEQAVRNVRSRAQYEVLWLRYIDGLKWSDVARQTHKTRQAVYKTKRRALRTIGRQRGAYIDDL